jgi:adenylate cyclase
LVCTILMATLFQASAQKRDIDVLLETFQMLQNSSKEDSIGLKRAFEITYNIVLSPAEYYQLRKVLEANKNVLPRDIYYAFEYYLIQGLVKGKSFILAIDEAKALVTRLEKYENTLQKTLLQSTLALLRIPYRNSNQLYEGIDYFNQKAAEYSSKNDSDLLSLSYYSLRALYAPLGLLEKAIYFQLKSAQFLNPHEVIHPLWLLSQQLERQSLGVMGFINRKAVTGFMYNENREPAKALPYLHLAKVYADKYKDTLYIHDRLFVYMELFSAHYQLQTDSATYWLEQTRKVFQESRSDPEYLLRLQLMEAQMALSENKLDEAERYARKAVELFDSFGINNNSFVGILIPRLTLAEVLFARGKYSEIIPLLTKESDALKGANLRKYELEVYELLAEALKKTGKNYEALETLQKYIQLQQEILRDEYLNRIISFDIEQRIARNERDLLQQTLENRRRKNQQLAAYIIVGLLLVTLLLILRNYRAKLAHNLLLQKERDRSESLLLNILPSEVADELKHNGYSKARQYNQVTVLFTDFVNFTGISEQLSPTELVEEIHRHFTVFDSIIEEFGLEKIKTIGDAYLAVCGLPMERDDHAIRVTKAALAIRAYMENTKSKFHIRVGLHTGPVVAGIVGVKKYAYDIWGDTVNTAARMEQHSEAGKINISESTYLQVNRHFVCTPRGPVQAKNKGNINMYFVESEKNQ